MKLFMPVQSIYVICRYKTIDCEFQGATVVADGSDCWIYGHDSRRGIDEYIYNITTIDGRELNLNREELMIMIENFHNMWLHVRRERWLIGKITI